MKVCHLITGLDTGGTEMMLYKLISSMNRSRFQNVVVSMTSMGTLARKIEAMGISVFELDMRPGMPNPIAFWRLVRLLLRERPQILQTWLYHADLLGLLSGKLAQVPSIVWNLRCSELKKDDHSYLFFKILWLLAKLSHIPKAVIVNSSSGRVYHEYLGYKPCRWEYIPNGFDTDLFCPSQDAYLKLRRSLGVSDQTPLVGLVGRFHPMKDHETFLKAASLLHKVQPSVHFVVVGQGVDKRNELLMNQIKALGLNKNVYLLGNRDDIHDITAGLDIAGTSSYGEGFPNVIGEGMSCAVPCVVTDVGDSAYIVGDTGLVIPPQDPYAMSNAWAKLLSMNEHDRRALGLGARKRIIKLFSLKSIVNQYERLYTEIGTLQNR